MEIENRLISRDDVEIVIGRRHAFHMRFTAQISADEPRNGCRSVRLIT